ncbi:LL-diaminopimelate aminotransferase [Paenibacillus larvae subsp. pulvifaciens]|uniref:LL-diaminopimelate aminotransferase n=1 Tax=Paenibacillus larvae subsp. pulvifaciens TaxID=1477 RepID=A0A1V0UPA9_9BACL|nr:pyridoxal phosphate-dependent aminotransferase [Paenibacillus larvae]ARF66967.1 LL-diaminopimelate aminotransferase [Paenibacillus larvae subsp. pulvifaciens]
MTSDSIYSLNIQGASRMAELPEQFFAGLVKKAAAETAKGHDIINLGQGNPDRPTPSHIVKKLKQAVENPLYHKYPPFSGYSFLKEAICRRYLEDYGVSLDPETEVAILFGGKTGLVEISQCLLNPGDVCLVPDPGYPDYLSGVSLAGGKTVMMPLLSENGFLPVFENLPSDEVTKAKLMFLNYPNNPTAAVATADFYDKAIAFAAENGIAIASDFAYGAIGFDRLKPVSFLERPYAKEVGVEFYTLSKTYSMAGWRVGFALGNREIIRLLNLMHDHLYVSLFGAVQEAAAEALTGPQQCVTELRKLYEGRRNTLFRSLELIGWKAVPSAGSFFAWLPVPAPYSSAEFADLLLQKAHVVTAPGIGFGQHGEGYVRVGLLTSEERLQEAVHRIGRLNLFT